MSSYACLEGAKRALNHSVWRGGFAVLCISAMIGTSACRSSDGTSSTSNPSPTASQPAAPTGQHVACDNPYYPAEKGSIRNYKITGGGSAPSTLTYSEQKTNVTVGSFIDHREFSDGARDDAWWYCTPDGLVASEYSIPAIVRLSSAYQLESARATGPALPPADKWATGYEWTTSYVVAGTQKSPGSQSMEKFTGTIEVKSQIVSADKTTVPAGSYDCLLVDSTIRDSLKIEAASGALRPILVSVRVSAWYAKGVGLVRASFTGDTGSGRQELMSISKATP